MISNLKNKIRIIFSNPIFTALCKVLCSILCKVLCSIFRFLFCFFMVFFIIGAIYGELSDGNWKALLESLRTEIFPIPMWSFITILGVSVLFVFFTITVSWIYVLHEQNYFKNSFFIRFFLFLMNAIPIVLFFNLIFPKPTSLISRFPEVLSKHIRWPGFNFIYFFIVYLFLKFLFDYLFINIYKRLNEKNRLMTIFLKGLFEFTVVFISIVVIFFIKPMPFEGRQFNPDGFKEMLAYVFYFLFFNFITFFTVEYCVGIIRAEYKKNYTKYFFMHDSNILKRVWFIQRKSLALTLEKIKNSITWLIMFIVMNEILFERAGSIGKSIIDSYSRSNGTLNLVYNITTLIFINIVMNLVIDCLIIFSSNKSVSGKDNIGNITKEHLKYENNNMFPKRKKSFIITVVGLSSIVFIFYIASILFNNKYYAIAGYYDFSEDSRRTVGNLFSFYKTNIRVNIDLPKGTLEKYGDTPLVKKSECGDYFTVIVLYVQNKCNTTTLLPYRDPETRRHFYIDGNINLGEKEFSPEDTIIDIGSQDVFKNMPFIEKTKSFRLQTGIGKNLFVNKPLFLIIPFYFCFFISLCLVTIIFTWLLYKLTIHFQIRKNGKIQVMASKSFNLVLVFFNSITLLVVLLIVNLFLQRHKVGFTQININSTFFDVLFNYVIVQVVVNFMFCLSYKNEIAQHINYIFSSNEFEYYDRIGMDTRRKKYIYKKKYGDNLLLKYISQNILFVFNINWFLSFAFNRWDEIGAKVFTDKIGLTYAISFENIFTKIISLRKDFVAIHDIVSLVILNVILFWGYCIFQRKFYNGNR